MTKLQPRQSFFSRLHLLLNRLRSFFQRHRVVSMVVGQVVVIGAIVVFVLNSVLGMHLFSAFAQTSCAAGDTVYTVQTGDTLGSIATAHGVSLQALAQYNQIADPNSIYANQQICIPGNGTGNVSQQGVPLHNTANLFPYGQCTWWAAQRYQELHGFFVPWTTNSDAWQWTARANDFQWHVSNQPSIGAIIDLQPGVQQASATAGHVGVVEQILSNGDVVASNMNVLGYPTGSVVNLTFHTGAGVTFITA